MAQWCDWPILPDAPASQPQPTPPSPGSSSRPPTYLGPGADPPLGGAGVAVAGSPRLGPVVVAVLVVDDPRAVVVQRLDAADRAHLHARLAAGLAAVLPLLRHPAGGGRKKTEEQQTRVSGLSLCRAL